MAAEGMFCRQLLGVSGASPKMKETAAYLRTRLPAPNATDYYYWYYGTLSLYQHGGPAWTQWNERIKKLLLSSQNRSGANAGSWDPKGQWHNRMGRVVTTAMATLSLEVYYRYLPIYGAHKGAERK
jgi:hypothetical protein